MSQRSCSPYSDRNAPKKKRILKGRLDSNEKIVETGQSKITNFFKNVEKKPKLTPKPTQKILMDLEAQHEHLKEQQHRLVCQKQQMLQEQAQSKFEFQVWLKKSRFFIQQCVSQIYNEKRINKAQIDSRKGFYDSSCRIFTQGRIGHEHEIEKNRLQLMLSNGDYQNQWEEQALVEMLADQQKKLEQYGKELFAYKERLRIAHQEKSCKFASSWPLLSHRYQVLQLLGKGGFSEVYRAYDLEENRYVALKVSQTSGLKSELAHYIVREYENHMKLDHPNIAKLISVLEVTSDSVHIILEYCEGPELSNLIKQKKKLTETRAKHIMKQILSALDYLSSLNPKIIHYDLKPQNIMFCNGKIKILDFGLSRQIDNQHSRIALSNQGIGTYWYLPPESFNEKNPEISEKVDIWSAGVIFYEMLFGRKPFGHNKSQNSIYQEGIILQANQVQFPEDIEVSESCKSLIRHCLAYSPSERYSPSQALSHRLFK